MLTPGTSIGAFDEPFEQAPPGVDGTAAAAQDQAAVRDLPQAWMTHYNGGDAAKVASLYAEDAFYLSAHVLARGREQIREYWGRGIAAGGHVDRIEPIFVSVSGTLGYFVGRYEATNAGVTVDGRLLIVVRKEDGVCIAAHETVVRDQPE
jgi:ketosteroid isomerase-like protein